MYVPIISAAILFIQLILLIINLIFLLLSKRKRTLPPFRFQSPFLFPTGLKILFSFHDVGEILDDHDRCFLVIIAERIINENLSDLLRIQSLALS